MSKVVFVLCAVLFVSVFSADCSFVVQSENNQKYYKYDLNKMSHASGVQDELYYRIPDDGSYIYMNICGPSNQQCTTGSAVCLRSSDASQYTSLGMATQQEVDDASDLDPGQGVSITYSGGDDCILGSWQTAITIQCDPSASGVGEIVEVDNGECWYRVTIKSKYGCGKEVGSNSDESGSGDAGETAAIVILVILVVCVILYFGVGVIYQKKVKDASNFQEYIIHNEFWCSLPSLVKDGFLFIIHGCKKGDYVSV